MRFDDRLETVSRIDPDTESGRTAIWYQLIDMLAQTGATLPPAAAAKALGALALVRRSLPPAVRAHSVTGIAARCSYAPLIAFLANDHPRVAVAAVDNANLSTESWLTLLPELGPLGRSRLRRRTGLDPRVLAALTAYGPTDFALAAPLSAVSAETEAVAALPLQSTDFVENSAENETRSHDISELVRRIDRYRADRERPRSHGFRCDSDGLLRAVDGLNRALFVGISLYQPARPTEAGCDAGVARAFGKRAPIRNGRLLVHGQGHDSGYWLIDADAEFESETGRFAGYRGTLRPMGADDRTEVGNSPAPEQATNADGMRQLVHELRSPLNAISGFSQLIGGQFFGPVSATYRSAAQSILDDTLALTAALEDIELAARLDAGRIEPAQGQCDIVAVARAVAASHALPVPRVSGTTFKDAADAALLVAVDERTAFQLLRRLVKSASDLSNDGEAPILTIAHDARNAFVEVQVDGGQQLDSAALSAALANDSSMVGEAKDVVLGPGFGLRLVGQMCELHGGKLLTGGSKFILRLPMLVAVRNRVDALV